jgi:hypothetical protein
MRHGEPIAGLGGVALLVAGALDFDVVHALLIVFGLLALAVPVTSLTTSGPAKSIGTAVLASAFGWIAIVLALVATDWVALAGAIVAWVGSWLSLRDESTPGAAPPDVPRLNLPAA